MIGSGGIERLVEPAEMRIPVVGIFALGIGVVDDQAEAAAVRRRIAREFQNGEAVKPSGCTTS